MDAERSVGYHGPSRKRLRSGPGDLCGPSLSLKDFCSCFPPAESDTVKRIVPPVAVSDPGVTQEAAAGGHVVSGRGQGRSFVDYFASEWTTGKTKEATSSQERDTSAGILVIWTLHLHTETAAQRYQETAKRGRGNSSGLPLLILQEMMLTLRVPPQSTCATSQTLIYELLTFISVKAQ
ncbi:hypothetical protein KUCAC02_001137 [Chaenocephalus aceratus]|uniref:Uncharacterized protein n=1 Tax=Chaenocephalus aceratus TaxID=36190 RepID=A0ACB9XVG6_CHAAC|nr:hypothetical protein KUCAC02_001137 [Chaenocephalus aceratus]